MSSDPFWITDLHGGRRIEISTPLSSEADDFLRACHRQGCSEVDVSRRFIECRAHDDDSTLRQFRDPNDGQVHDIWMYVVWSQHRARWELRHFPFHRNGITLPPHIVPIAESDGHRWMKDGWQEALEAGGCDATQEHRVGDRRFDVYATIGGRSYAIECDHSTRDLKTAQTKERKDVKLGLSATLFCADRNAPDYAFKVPHTEVIDVELARRRTLGLRQAAITRGPQMLEWDRCAPGHTWMTCPELPRKARSGRRRPYCGREHPVLKPWMPDEDAASLTVEDVAAMVPAGEMVVARTNYKSLQVCLMSADDARDLAEYQRAGLTPTEAVEVWALRHSRVVTVDQMQQRRPAEERADVPEPRSAPVKPPGRRELVWSPEPPLDTALRPTCERCGSSGGGIALVDTEVRHDTWHCTGCGRQTPARTKQYVEIKEASTPC